MASGIGITAPGNFSFTENNLSQEELFDPSSSSFTINQASTKMTWTREGQWMFIRGYLSMSSTVSGTMRIDMPAGYTVDTSKVGASPDVVSVGRVVGQSSTLQYEGLVMLESASLLRLVGNDAEGNFNSVHAWASGDTLSFEIRVPVTEFAGSQNSLIAFGEATGDTAGLVKFESGTRDATELQAAFTTQTLATWNFGSGEVWYRIGDMVTVAGRIGVNTTAPAGTFHRFDMDPPIASNFGGNGDGAGAFQGSRVDGNSGLYSVGGTDVMRWDFNADSGGTCSITYQYTYRIIS